MQYVSLEQQGFYEPFRRFGEAVGRIGAAIQQRKKDKLAEEQLTRENTFRDRQIKVDEERMSNDKLRWAAEDKDRALVNSLREAQLKEVGFGLAEKNRKAFLESFDPTPELNKLLQADAKSRGYSTPDEVTQPGAADSIPEEYLNTLTGIYQAAAPAGVKVSPTDVAEAYRRRTAAVRGPTAPSGLVLSGAEGHDAAGNTLKFTKPLEPMVEQPILGPDGKPGNFVRIGEDIRAKPAGQMTEGDKALAVNINELRTNLETLKKVIADWGNFELGVPGVLASDTRGAQSGLTSNEAAAMLKTLPYRIAIGYSKVVDPATAAREGEVVSAQKYALPMGVGTPNEVTLTAIDDVLKEVGRREASYATLREQAGLPPVSVGAQVAPPGAAAPAAAGAPVTVQTQDEFNGLQPGTPFIWGPTGEQGVKN